MGNAYYEKEELVLALRNYEIYLELAGDSATTFVITRVVELRGS